MFQGKDFAVFQVVQNISNVLEGKDFAVYQIDLLIHVLQNVKYQMHKTKFLTS